MQTMTFDAGLLQHAGVNVRDPYAQWLKGTALYSDAAKQKLKGFDVNLRIADRAYLSDAQMELNTGFPVQYFNFIDPNIITTVFAATNAVKLLPEKHLGNFEDQYASFVVESEYGTSRPYDDFNSDGGADVQYNWLSRDNFRHQTSITVGDLEAAAAGKAQISLMSRKQLAATNILGRRTNELYLYGVQGLKNYGFLNDPGQDAPLQALAVEVNGKSVTTWQDKRADAVNGANHIYNDIVTLWNTLLSKNGGNVSPTSSITLAMSEKVQINLNAVNNYNVNVTTLLKNQFPNIEQVIIPEFSTKAGEMVYLICNDSLDGTGPGFFGFGEKIRVGRIIQNDNSIRQKYAASTFGCVITRPSLIASMIGV